MTNTCNNLTDYERGEFDCVHGHQARDCETSEYYSGYGTEYARQACASWYSEKQFLDIMGASE